jgi:hypothetical protein
MAYKVNGAFTGGLMGAGAGVAWADDLALITLHAANLTDLPPEVLLASTNVFTGAYGLILTVLVAVASKLLSPYLVAEKGNETSTPAVPGA